MRTHRSALQLFTSDEHVSIAFTPCTRASVSWRDELRASALSIANAAKKPLWIAMSGGWGSEIMARSFFDQGINFSALTLEHIGGTNALDVKRAREWCFSHGVPHKIVPMDEHVFLGSETDAAIARGFTARTIYRYVQLKLLDIVERLGGYAVIGHGKLLFRSRASGSQGTEGFTQFSRSYFVPFDWMDANTASHEPFFFLSMPEIVDAYLRSPFMAAACENQSIFKAAGSDAALRRLTHLYAWPDIKPRTPFLGFEHIPGELKAAETRIRSAFEDTVDTTDISIDQMLRQLDPNTVQTPAARG